MAGSILRQLYYRWLLVDYPFKININPGLKLFSSLSFICRAFALRVVLAFASLNDKYTINITGSVKVRAVAIIAETNFFIFLIFTQLQKLALLTIPLVKTKPLAQSWFPDGLLVQFCFGRLVAVCPQ